jgi:hypothetical protein
MLTIPVTLAVSPEMAIAALMIAASVLVRMITRLVLCVLAAAAARRALEDLASGQADAHDAIRAHRLAVMEAILAVLARRDSVEGGRRLRGGLAILGP